MITKAIFTPVHACMFCNTQANISLQFEQPIVSELRLQNRKSMNNSFFRNTLDNSTTNNIRKQ